MSASKAPIPPAPPGPAERLAAKAAAAKLPGGGKLPPKPAAKLRAPLRWPIGYALVLVLAVPFIIYYASRFDAIEPPRYFRFANPGALLMLLSIPLLAWVGFHLRARRGPSFAFSRVADLGKIRPGTMTYLAPLPTALRMLALGLFVFGLARPQVFQVVETTAGEGIDIMIVLDVSNSMEESDLRPNRLAAAKATIDDFIDRRSRFRADRIGLVVFGREAYTACPLTLDYSALRQLLADVELGIVDGRGTAIGNGLGNAINRLRRSSAPSKVIILLTDGDNNAGNLDPRVAADLAAQYRVKVYTILAGDIGGDSFGGGGFGRSKYPVNPKLLEEIAGKTGGLPYLASDTAALEQRFHQLLKELKTTTMVERREKASEKYALFILPALLLLALELMLSMTRFRRFP